MADPALETHPNAVLSGESNQSINIDISDVPRSPGEHGCARFAGGGVLKVVQAERAPRIGHMIVDHQFSFARNAIDDVVDADGLRHMMDKVNEPSHAAERKQHRARYRCGRYKGVW